MTKLLSMGLNESKLIRVLDENSTYGILKKYKLDEVSKYTREDLVKIADEGGVSYTVSGSLMKAGESIIIMLTLQNPNTDEVANPIKVTCQNEAEILPKTDELVAKIKSGMNLSPAQLSAEDTQVLKKLTTSPEALKYWLESPLHYAKGEYAQGVALCEKAVELDPNFANAYVNLAAGYEYLGNAARGREYRKKAFELRDRIPEDERLFIEGQYYIALPGDDSKAKAIEAFEKYLNFQPNDVGALDCLGYLYGSIGNRTKSLEYLERLYRIEPSPEALARLLVDYQKAGQLDRAEEALKDHYKNYQDGPVIQRDSCQFYIVRKNFKQALAEIERGFLQNPAPENWSWDNLKGNVYLAQGNLSAAEKEYLRVIEKAIRPKYVSDATYNLIRLNLLEGKMKRAADELAKATAPGGAMQGTISWGVACAWIRLGQYDKALEIFETWLKNAMKREDPDGIRLALLNKGSVYVSKKDFGEAEKIAGDLKDLGQKSPAKDAMGYYQALQGLIDLKKGDYSKGIDNLGKISGWYAAEVFSGVQGHAWYYYPLGLAHYKFGRSAQGAGRVREADEPDRGKVGFRRPLRQELLLAGEDRRGAEG